LMMKHPQDQREGAGVETPHARMRDGSGQKRQKAPPSEPQG
jgi:hypothetical protein